MVPLRLGKHMGFSQCPVVPVWLWLQMTHMKIARSVHLLSSHWQNKTVKPFSNLFDLFYTSVAKNWATQGCLVEEALRGRMCNPGQLWPYESRAAGVSPCSPTLYLSCLIWTSTTSWHLLSNYDLATLDFFHAFRQTKQIYHKKGQLLTLQRIHSKFAFIYIHLQTSRKFCHN